MLAVTLSLLLSGCVATLEPPAVAVGAVPAVVGSGGGSFGTSVAASGDTMLVGALLDGVNRTGSVYVFTRGAQGWEKTQVLEPEVATDDAFFGSSVAVQGNTLAVGARGEGAVYLYTRSGSRWALQSRLQPADATPTDHFGTSLDLSGDVLAVGASSKTTPGHGTGAVYLFRRTDHGWKRTAVLTSDVGSGLAMFGTSVALDGATLAVGASQEPLDAGASGSVYLFHLNGQGAEPLARLRPPQAGVAHGFGTSVSLHDDLLAVGTPGDDYGGYGSGPVFVYRHTGAGWNAVGQLTPPAPAPSEHFGTALAVWDGAITVGSVTDNDIPMGTVKVLVYRELGASWGLDSQVTIAHHTASPRYVALVDAGSRLIVGSASSDGSGQVLALGPR